MFQEKNQKVFLLHEDLDFAPKKQNNRKNAVIFMNLCELTYVAETLIFKHLTAHGLHIVTFMFFKSLVSVLLGLP